MNRRGFFKGLAALTAGFTGVSCKEKDKPKMPATSANIMVSNPVTPFTMSRSFKACSNGKIFIGLPDTDPTFPQNQIPVYVENECGNTVQVPQPIVINTAGYPVYHGQVAKFVTTQNYSMAVYDSYMVQQFYWPNLASINPEALRNELASADGFKMIGRIATLADLRLLEPTQEGQTVILERAVTGGPLLNEMITYDTDDTTSADNGVYIFVTSGGARWKANIANGLDPRLAGYLEGSQDMAASINICAKLVVENFISKTPVANTINTINIPYPEDGAGVYFVSETISIPGIATLRPRGNIIFDLTGVNKTSGLRVCNSDFAKMTSDATDVSDDKYNSHMMTMEVPNDPIVGGKLKFRKTYDSSDTESFGIMIGNTATGFSPIRNITTRNGAATGFYLGAAFGTYDTYICGFEGSYSFGNHHALGFTDVERHNSGEKFFFNGGGATISDSYAAGIFMNCNGIELHISGVSIDYTTSDAILFGPAANSDIYITHSHIEGIQGKIVNVPESTSASKYGRRVDFGFCNFDLSSGQKGSQGWNRDWFYSAAENCVVNIHKSCRVWYATNSQPKTAYPALCHYDSTNKIQLNWDVSEEELESWSTSLLGILKPGEANKKVISTNKFTGTSGDTYTGYSQARDSYGWFVYNGTWTYGDADTDGLQPIELTSTSASTIYYVVCAIPTPMLPGEYARAFGSIRIDSALTGAVYAACTIDTHSLLAAGSATLNDTTISSAASASVNLLPVATANSLIGDYQGFSTPAAQVPLNTYGSNPPMFSYVGIRLSGFVGKISLKLPTVTTHVLLMR